MDKERKEAAEKFRMVVGTLLKDDNIVENTKPRARMEPTLPFRIVYTRDFVMRCAFSPYATLPPKNIRDIVTEMSDIVARFPCRHASA